MYPTMIDYGLIGLIGGSLSGNPQTAVITTTVGVGMGAARSAYEYYQELEEANRRVREAARNT